MRPHDPSHDSAASAPVRTRSALRTALVCACALGFLGLEPHAQVGPLDYATNWQPMLDTTSAAFSGPGLFGGAPGGSVSGAIRRCYGIDSIQGGRNQSQGVFTNTWFKTAQGFGAMNPTPGVDLGLISVQAATSSDIGADVCLSPFFVDPTSTGGHKVVAAAVIGLQSGTASGAFPTVWESAFQWIGGAVSGPTTLGVDGSGLPLLANLIYEIQGPLNSTGSTHYYLASTTENTGVGAGGSTSPGGVTNGNWGWGTSVFNMPAGLSGVVSHSRLFTSGGLATAPFLSTPGDMELSATLAFKTPTLWASNDGNAGAGGADWHVGVLPVSVIDLRVHDVLAGGQTNSSITPPFPGLPAVAYDPNIVLNRSWFVWSATVANSMLQRPMSWDDLGGTSPPLPGSIALGPVATKRAGLQTVPATLDALTLAVLPHAAFSLGGSFSDDADPFLDGIDESSLFEGMFGPITRGVSTLAGGPLPILGGPATTLVGCKLGVAAVGLQIDVADGHWIQMTEWANGLTINLQL
jgi:hypothetical protein